MRKASTCAVQPSLQTLAVAAILVAFVSTHTPSAQAGTPVLHVLPWNGHKAAISLTFDDGDPSQWGTALPALDARGLKATFFLIGNNLPNKDVWVKAAQEGHEIGNHTMTHSHPKDFTAKQIADEASGAQKLLQTEIAPNVVTFAYPFTEVTPELKDAVKASHIGARGGWGASYYLKPTDTPDWFNIPSQATMTATPIDTYKNWIDTTESQGAWSVFMIHAIEGSTWYQPVPKKTFYALLDRLKADADIWVAPFGSVCAYWQAEKILEATVPSNQGHVHTYAWSVPSHCPKGVNLQVTLDDVGKPQLKQSGRLIKPNAAGVYTVSFDSGEFQVVSSS